MTMTILYHESCDILCGIFEYGLTIERQVPEIRIHRARAGSSVPQLGLGARFSRILFVVARFQLQGSDGWGQHESGCQPGTQRGG